MLTLVKKWCFVVFKVRQKTDTYYLCPYTPPQRNVIQFYK